MVTTRKRKSTTSQSNTKKRKRDPKVRQSLIENRNHIIENRSALVDSTNDEFKQTLEKIDKSARNVTHASDATLVCEQTDMMSSILQEQTRKCDANTAKVSIDEMISAIKDGYSDENNVVDLNKLYELVHSNYNGVPPLFCFNNVNDMNYVAKPKKKRKVQRAKPQVVAPETLKKAKEKEQEDSANSTDTTNRVQGLVQALSAMSQRSDSQEDNTFRLLEILTNPESFSESLENIYDFSHVTSQGIVKIFLQGGAPVCQYLGQDGMKQAKQSKNRQQFCLSFDGSMHSQLKEHMTQSQIPTRSQLD